MEIKELGHVVLYVTNLRQSAHFYRDILGFKQIGEIDIGSGVAAFSSGRTHHELLLIEIGGTAKERKMPEPGLYHIGFKVGEGKEELKKVYKELKEKEVRIIGSSDHTVTNSLYILDPDGNELELYTDVSDVWKKDPLSVLSPVKPLNLN